MEEYFINIGIDSAIKDYIANLNNQNGLVYNSFLVVIIRSLVLIYGNADIINPYKLKDKVAFFNNLTKYGLSKTDASIFTEDFLSFYNVYKENNQVKEKIYTLEAKKEDFEISKEKGRFIVKGKKVDSIMRKVNIEDYESLFYLHRKLDEIGLNKELKKQGIKEGDIVKIGEYEMEWED